MLSSFMAGFILYHFDAHAVWWVGFIIIMLFEVLYELDQLEKRRRFKK
jgi:hypothetical protein